MSFLRVQCGVGGGSKITKAYLSETFGCSIYEIGGVILGVQWRGEEKGNESVSFRNVPKQYYSMKVRFYDVRFMR